MKAYFSISAALLFLIATASTAQTGNNFYVPGNNNRMAAEWEPALGTMITWPLCIPYKLVIELAKDNHLYVLVENEQSKMQALQAFAAWRILSSKFTFIFAPQGIDAWWVRDWGPPAVFTPGGKMKLADGKYIFSTPVTDIGCNDSLYFLYKTADNQIIKTTTEDSATFFAGKGLNTEVLDLPFISTGGNVLTDGIGSAFSTCIAINENKFYDVDSGRLLELNKQLLGISNYHIISNFEKRGIQHIDCLLKLLDEERILVMEPPADHELYPVYENIVQQELAKLTTVYGRPYEILRIKTDRYKEEALAAYTNSIIINKTIYVPLFKIPADSIALKRWQEVMPGYTIKGFEFTLADEPLVTQKMRDQYKLYGWNNGDALHCRTRAVWDSAMLFITTKKIEPLVNSLQENKVYTTIIDYSKKGLVKKKTMLVWRMVGATNWNYLPLTEEDSIHFSAIIPWHKSGTTIEYYISSVSKSGKTETQPRTAPAGTYRFSIKK